MNPDLFADELILSPSTAHRISHLTRLKRPDRPLFTAWLLARKINAFAFFQLLLAQHQPCHWLPHFNARALFLSDQYRTDLTAILQHPVWIPRPSNPALHR
jgi:hypothetical protein